MSDLARIYALPKEQWLSLSEICRRVGVGDHNKALWKLLCQMDDGKRTYNGYVFEGSSGRARFRWTKAVR